MGEGLGLRLVEIVECALQTESSVTVRRASLAPCSAQTSGATATAPVRHCCTR